MSRKKNNYFRFKQFLVQQGDVGMKVTTEACILGSWVSTAIHPLHILDIGTGTGLLALMMAQKFPVALIDAVEVEQNASRQALGNFEDLPGLKGSDCTIVPFRILKVINPMI